jgi:predicted nucleic acid-binding protein
MTLVVDANVAIKWFVQQQGSDDARRVQAYPGPLIAPALLIATQLTTAFT